MPRTDRTVHTYIRSTLALLTTAMTLAVFVGCQSKQHDEAVNAANARWYQMRSELMLNMAQQRFDTGDLDQAQSTLREAMSVHPTNPELYVLAGRIELERGKLEKAYRLLDTALKFDEDRADAFYYQGLVLQRWQRFDDALAKYEKAFAAEPDNVAYLTAASEMDVATRGPDAAIERLESKIDYFDQSASLRLTMAHLYLMKRDYTQAAHWFEKASILKPDDTKLREELAKAQIAAGNHKPAIRNLKSLLTNGELKGRPDLKRALANAYIATGENREAREAYLELSRTDAMTASDWVQLAELSWSLDDDGGTLVAASKAIRLDRDRHDGYLLAGLVWQKRGRVDDALRMFDRSAQLAPTDATPLIMRGLTLQKVGRPEAAAEAYRQALQRQPDHERARRLLSNVQTSAVPTP